MLVVLLGCALFAGIARATTRPAPPTPAASAIVAECPVPGSNRTIDQIWRPDMRGALAYARTRIGDIAFAVRTDRRFYGYRADHVEWSASVVKAMLMVAYLDQASVALRPLNRYDNSLLRPMITVSDNSAPVRSRASSAMEGYRRWPAASA